MIQQKNTPLDPGQKNYEFFSKSFFPKKTSQSFQINLINDLNNSSIPKRCAIINFVKTVLVIVGVSRPPVALDMILCIYGVNNTTVSKMNGKRQH
jgi:hypothetical protein